MCELWRGVRVYTVYYLATAFRLVSSVGSFFFSRPLKCQKWERAMYKIIPTIPTSSTRDPWKRSTLAVSRAVFSDSTRFNEKWTEIYTQKKKRRTYSKPCATFLFFFIFDPIEMCGFRKSLSAFLITSGQFSWVFQITILPNQFPENNEYLILFNGLFHM